jgi:hypothetical protein
MPSRVLRGLCAPATVFSNYTLNDVLVMPVGLS